MLQVKFVLDCSCMLAVVLLREHFEQLVEAAQRERQQ